MTERSEIIANQIIVDHMDVDAVFEHFVVQWKDHIGRGNNYGWKITKDYKRCITLESFDGKAVLAERTFTIVNNKCLGKIDI